MTTDFDPLSEFANFQESELNEFAEQQQEEVARKTRKRKPRESFVCFISFYESIELMPERLHLRAYNVLMRYAYYQEEPPQKTPSRIMQSFVSWKKQLDASSQKYDKKVESNWSGNNEDDDGT